jgi:hypothetical protein
LNAAYKAYVKPVLQYSFRALIIEASVVLNKLEMMQNQALRLVTGTIRSTPLASVQVLTLKTEKRGEKMTLIQHETLIHLPYKLYWSQYRYHDRNPNTQKSFMQK